MEMADELRSCCGTAVAPQRLEGDGLLEDSFGTPLLGVLPLPSLPPVSVLPATQLHGALRSMPPPNITAARLQIA